MKEPFGALEIPFSFESGHQFDLDECDKFWHAPDTISWFQERGYTYRPQDGDGSALLPFLANLLKLIIHMPIMILYGKVLFAQDSHSRHVAIKLIRTNTDEHRILRFLSQQSLETLKENCLIPALDFLHNEEFTFVVMPRWGSAIHLPLVNRARDVLHIIRCMLKALAFLHENNISHGDVNQSNVLVNHFSDSEVLEQNLVRANLRSQGLLLYALFDFDFSVMLPLEGDRTKYRLPYVRSWGTFNCTMDTAQGEFDYNPFVMDVGTMGVRFCKHYQHLTGEIPMLAPLLDRMTTRNLQRRFTAFEALHFFEAMYSQLTEDDLGQLVETRFEFMELDLLYDEYDRWKRVPKAFAEKWDAYREPPIPWTTKTLRAICRKPWMCHVVPWIRWTFSVIWNVPRQFYASRIMNN
ncbi:hypothetical protein CPB84DRAFT_1765442 [Gymnopilus junonius]|uniref:Protein kinase domain-containing protein n=1 Tax=Gymnopilus junonius TaxID=109634 RepID=A0A9P5NZ53_GYMJU|nr:hypothetical protein CPB84DRAFT_1765442 [Gymnopilus junonius]